MLKQVNKHRPFLLRYLLYFIPISPMPHSNICRGAKEIFLYPIRGYSNVGTTIFSVTVWQWQLWQFFNRIFQNRIFCVYIIILFDWFFIFISVTLSHCHTFVWKNFVFPWIWLTPFRPCSLTFAYPYGFGWLPRLSTVDHFHWRGWLFS